MLNYEYRKAIDAMRRDGYALIVLDPEQLHGLNPKKVEGCLMLGFASLIARPDVEKILENTDVHPNNTH